MRNALVAAIVAALVAGGSTAYATISHSFGWGGKTYTFDAQCRRVTFVPPGISDHESINVLAQQNRCLVHRPDPFARCVKRLGVPPIVTEKSDHGPGKPGDEIGAARLGSYVASLYACSRARLG